MEVINLPPPAKITKGWIMRPALHEKEGIISKVQYPPVGPSGGMEGAVTLSAPPMRVSYSLPEHIVGRADTPTVGWWDEEQKAWKTEGITDVSFDEESRMLTFHTLHLTNLAVLQVICRIVFDQLC